MLDVVITVSDGTPATWVHRCRTSVRDAAACAGYPVTVIEQPGVPGHVGQAMHAGRAKSTAQYVAWVDDDDWVLPNAFACLSRHFAARPQAICARQIQQTQTDWAPYTARHHLTAWRRDVVADFDLAAQPCGVLAMMLEKVKDTAVDELSWVYVRRMYDSPALKLRRQHGRASI